MNTLDLQIQTTASDGKHSPAECVRMARENGVLTVAITDHDTVAGISEALAAGEELGIRVIPGIELSIQEHGMHLLGLGIDVESPSLLKTLEEARQNRLTAARQMVENFQKDGFVVEWDDVVREAGGAAVVSRPHIVGAIMKRPENRLKLAGITTKWEFFQKYFTDKSPYYVRASTITPKGAIKLVHDAGGVAVWSHPPVPDFVGNCSALEQFLQELISYDLDGLELCGPFLAEGDIICLETAAARYHLLKTAGSDFHERYDPAGKPWPRSAATIGEFPTYGRALDDILPALDLAMERRHAVAKRR